MEGINLLKQTDVERILGLKASTLEQMRLTGRGPMFCKIGRSVRYRVEDLSAWIESRTFNNTTQVNSKRTVAA